MTDAWGNSWRRTFYLFAGGMAVWAGLLAAVAAAG